MKTGLRSIPGTMITLILCVLVYLGINLALFPDVSTTGSAILLGAYYKPFILAGEWWRLFTVGFTHVSFWHLFMNMYALVNLGYVLEHNYGTIRFLLLLFLSVIGGSLLMLIKSNGMIAVGLSGGLYGCMAAMLMLFIRSGYMASPQVRSAVLQTLFINIMINFMPGVGVMAHLGGFLVGFVFSLVLDTTKEEKTLRINSVISTIALLGLFAAYAVMHSNVKENERYYQLDLEVLQFEEKMGLSNYTNTMANRLDVLYGNTIVSEHLH